MQQDVSRARLLELFDLLSPFEQKTVFTFVDSLSHTKTNDHKRDKSALVNLSTWTDEDVRVFEDSLKWRD